MIKRALFAVCVGLLLAGSSAFGWGPCSSANGKLACVIPQEYGADQPFAFSQTGLFAFQGHEGHFDASILNAFRPLTAEIGRQANLLPLASPSSGFVLTYDPSLKTFVTSNDSLGPILGERAETVGRHHLFVGFSYQFFNFNKIDSVDLHNIPVVLTHAEDNNVDNPGHDCAIDKGSLNGCAFVRDVVSTQNSIDLKVNQYTTYVTFGLTRNIDVSAVIPFESVRMNVTSQDTIILGSALFHDHLWTGCPDVTNPTPPCLNHTFPDAGFTHGSSPSNTASGIGDVVARVKWNAWHGERAGVAAGMDVRFPTGDALNYLGSGSYGAKPFAIFSYRARISPHALVGYEWNSDSIAAGDLSSGTKAKVPNDFVYSAGADAWITKWLTGSFDIIGQRILSTEQTIGGQVFGTQKLSVVSQQFLANCGACTANPTPPTVSRNTLNLSPNAVSYNVTNASMGVKIRPLGKLSKLVVTANVLVRLDEGGLSYKPVPLVGVGYTF
jgi:Putative MetA-pathway of phenol degradation